MGDFKIPDSLLPENVGDTIDKKLKERTIKKRKKMIMSGLSLGTLVATIALILFSVLNVLKTPVVTVDKTDDKTEILQLSSYDQLYSYHENMVIKEKIRDFFDIFSSKGSTDLITSNMPESMMDKDMVYGVAEDSANIAGSDDYSKTNVQTEGVDESDIVKTDGEYIYVSDYNGNLSILKADGAESKLVSKTSINDFFDTENAYYNVSAMYLYNDKIVMVVSGGSNVYYDDMIMEGEIALDYMPYYYDNNTYVLVISVEDRSKPVLVDKLSQEGSYTNSRMAGGYVYIYTDKYIDYTSLETVYAKTGDEVISEEDVYVTKDCDYNNYLIISSIDVENSSDFKDTIVYTTDWSYAQLYVSGSNIYILESIYNWEANTEKTNIVKISYVDGEMELKNNSYVKGTVNDQFSVDEYNDYLRVVTTDFDANNLYILDNELNITGKIEGLAEGERIYSARFMGDIGYFVTFRNMDPLFSVDLSDPSAPVVLGELKIPGFSTYLHFIDKDTLLGIGHDADIENGFVEGMKLSLFDVSDPGNVTEVQSVLFGDYSYSEALYNHTAILASSEKNIFGFSVLDWNNNKTVYKIYSFENGEMVEKESIDVMGSEKEYSYEIRGIYSGDFFYIVTLNNLKAYSLDEIISEETADVLCDINY